MQEIVMDGGTWTVPDDVYDSFFQAVGAPAWHGRNFNALRDSIGGGRINKVEVPYLIKLKNFASINAEAKPMAVDFIELIKGLRESGIPVDINIEN
jgi:RNAse (barnase) inhibitor barstar